MKTLNLPPPFALKKSPRTTQPPHPLQSAALFGASDEVLIVHGDETYRLRRTRQDKLILTK